MKFLLPVYTVSVIRSKTPINILVKCWIYYYLPIVFWVATVCSMLCSEEPSALRSSEAVKYCYNFHYRWTKSVNSPVVGRCTCEEDCTMYILHLGTLELDDAGLNLFATVLCEVPISFRTRWPDILSAGFLSYSVHPIESMRSECLANNKVPKIAISNESNWSSDLN